jgi:hypothetical protein
MADTAAHLVDAVLPRVPIRQWVCSFPWQLRYLMGYDRRLCALLMGAFVNELSRSYQHRAKRALALSSVSQALTGAVTFVQRFDSALRLNPHAHTLVLDGVYVRAQDGALEFHALPEPTLAEVSEVAAATAARIERVLAAHGRDFDERSDSGDDQLSLDHPALASCYRAATAGQQLLGEHPGQPSLRLVGQPRLRKTTGPACLVAEVRGVMCMPSEWSMVATAASSSGCAATSHAHRSVTTASPSCPTAGYRCRSRRLGRTGHRPLYCRPWT